MTLLTDSINEIEKEFKQNPANFNVEADIQFCLARKIQDKLEEKGEGYIQAKVLYKEENGTDDDKKVNPKTNIQYKSFLDAAIAEPLKKKTETCNEASNCLKRVILEPTLRKKDVDSNSDNNKNISRQKFDIGVLKDNKAQIIMHNGSKKYRAEDFAALIELKFIKNDHYYKAFAGDNGAGLAEETSITGAKGNVKSVREDLEKELEKRLSEANKNPNKKEGVWDDDYGIVEDFRKLSHLSENAGDVERIQLVFSNYDFLYEHDKKAATDTREINEKLYRALGESVRKTLEEFINKRENHRFDYVTISNTWEGEEYNAD